MRLFLLELLSMIYKQTCCFETLFHTFLTIKGNYLFRFLMYHKQQKTTNSITFAQDGRQQFIQAQLLNCLKICRQICLLNLSLLQHLFEKAGSHEIFQNKMYGGVCRMCSFFSLSQYDSYMPAPGDFLYLSHATFIAPLQQKYRRDKSKTSSSDLAIADGMFLTAVGFESFLFGLQPMVRQMINCFALLLCQIDLVYLLSELMQNILLCAWFLKSGCRYV